MEFLEEECFGPNELGGSCRQRGSDCHITSSADAERGFSIYDGCVNDQQKSSKEDKSEATVMIRHNETKRRLETKAGRDRLNEFRALVGRSREIDKAGDNVDDEDDQM